MSPGKISRRIAADRLAWIDRMLLKILAGYRNRMVHFYHEVTPRELYEICKNELGDIQKVKEAFASWIHAHPDYVNDAL
jgi:uncharacterized protein YutE (UPF0331/DUF86 family)